MTRKQFYILLIWSAALFAAGYFTGCEQNKAEPLKEMEPIKQKIQKKKKAIETKIIYVERTKEQLKPIEHEIKRYSDELQKAKALLDTVLIVQSQDSLIASQVDKIETLELVVIQQDEIIIEFGDVVNMQDQVITGTEDALQSEKKQNRRYKRQRNLALAGAAITATALTIVSLIKK